MAVNTVFRTLRKGPLQIIPFDFSLFVFNFELLLDANYLTNIVCSGLLTYKVGKETFITKY